jgi:hypothetical protein
VGTMKCRALSYNLSKHDDNYHTWLAIPDDAEAANFLEKIESVFFG